MVKKLFAVSLIPAAFFLGYQLYKSPAPNVVDSVVEPTPIKQLAAEGKLPDHQIKLIPPVSTADYIRGNQDAEVFIIEYSDYECPYCIRIHPTIKRALSEYGERLAWVYRHYPLDNLHPSSRAKAEAAECVGDLGGQDSFWSFTDALYSVEPNAQKHSLDDLPQLATQAGVNIQDFNSCLESGKFKNKVQKQYETGLSAGIQGTPGSFVINKEGEAWLVPGAIPYESLQLTLDQALQ